MCTSWQFFSYFNLLGYNLIAVISFARYNDTADVVALLYCKKMKLLKKKSPFLHQRAMAQKELCKNKKEESKSIPTIPLNSWSPAQNECTM